ncbi:MAG: hypothetical protein JWP29_4857 [Rhodoferax sp.]|nr:hypothetical protein [Rhodoferax sp.]
MAPRLSWDIFCAVVDNFGDIGVCWRLAADLAGRGHAVRLWVDDASALQWMAPAGCAGVEVFTWTRPLAAETLNGLATADVWIEAFGCDIPPEFVARGTAAVQAGARAPVWINLEYLSAESYVERNHALPSPLRDGAAAGGVKWFFYPGFTPRTGGLLREPDLLPRQQAFDAAAWRAALWPRLVHSPLGAAPEPTPAQWVSLFCYEPAALPALLRHWHEATQPTQLLVTAGRATSAVRHALGTGFLDAPGQLSISYLPALTQRDYDHLLWACDLNFVRGEDSVVRAIWAGKPFVWHIYPQDDGVHLEKLDAFLDMLRAPPSLRQAHHLWNRAEAVAAWPAGLKNTADWATAATDFRTNLLAQQDLTGQLLQFVLEKR